MNWILAQKVEPCEIKPNENNKHESETAVPEELSGRLISSVESINKER